ncbi:MAG TPA: hypothetical protein VGF07_03740 [Stellaceae bacterium]|jgi:hypothetical protein
MADPTIREAVAAFDDPEQLEAAVSELQSHGFDRADLSFLAPEALETHPAATAKGLADDPAAPRVSVTSETDARQNRVLGTSMAATIAAFIAAGFVVATGGLAAAAVAAAAAAGGVGAAGTWFGRKLAKDDEAFLDAQLARGGVLLWVRLHDRAAEERALEVLQHRSAHVHVHDLPAGAAVAMQTGPHAET